MLTISALLETGNSGKRSKKNKNKKRTIYTGIGTGVSTDMGECEAEFYERKLSSLTCLGDLANSDDPEVLFFAAVNPRVMEHVKMSCIEWATTRNVRHKYIAGRVSRPRQEPVTEAVVSESDREFTSVYGDNNSNRNRYSDANNSTTDTDTDVVLPPIPLKCTSGMRFTACERGRCVI